MTNSELNMLKQSQPHIQSVTAGCDRDNIASQRVLKKIGMELVEFRQNCLV